MNNILMLVDFLFFLISSRIKKYLSDVTIILGYSYYLIQVILYLLIPISPIVSQCTGIS